MILNTGPTKKAEENMTTQNNFAKIETGRSEKMYNGIKVVKTWIPSNFVGTVCYTATVNGKSFQSADWGNLKKKIRKNLQK